MKRGVIYARYSCDNQREESIDGQIRDCTAFAKAMTLKLLLHTQIEHYLQEVTIDQSSKG